MGGAVLHTIFDVLASFAAFAAICRPCVRGLQFPSQSFDRRAGVRAGLRSVSWRWRERGQKHLRLWRQRLEGSSIHTAQAVGWRGRHRL